MDTSKDLYLFEVSYFDQVNWKGRCYRAIANNKYQIRAYLENDQGTCSWNCLKDLEIFRIKKLKPPFCFIGEEI